MMKHTWLLLGLVGCGGTQQPVPLPYLSDKPPPPPLIPKFVGLAKYEPPPPPVVPVFLAANPPKLPKLAITVDLDDEARWPLPLSSHPMLEPHFDVAGTLAQPGISWTALCARGLSGRHLVGREQDVGEYLFAWCAAANNNVDDALYRFGKLKSAPNLRSSVVDDVADILVERGGADGVENLLRRSGLLEREIVDRLAASYHEVGRESDAHAINQLAIEMDREPTTATECHRLVRAAATGSGDEINAAIHELRLIVHPIQHTAKFRPDPTCRALLDKTRCAAMHDCNDYALELNGPGHTNVIAALDEWPSGTAGYDRWMWVVELAMKDNSEDAYSIALPALSMAIDTSQCLSYNFDPITMRIGELQAQHHNARFDAELQALEARATDLSALSLEQCQTRLRERVSTHP